MYIILDLPMYMIQSAGDDQLFINNAVELLRGNWFGSYNPYALNKMPGYTFFLSLPTILHLPLHIITELFYEFSIFFSAIAFKGILDKSWKRAVFILYLLYSPICFVRSGMLRIYRTSIIAPSVLLVVSGYAGLFLRKDGSIRNLIKWSVFTGVSSFFFWILREDSIWLLPFMVIAGIITGVFIVKERIKGTRIRVVILALPYLILLLGLNTIKLKNYMEYGVYVLTDFNEGNFAAATGNILRIEPVVKKKYVWLDQQTLSIIINNSPTLKSIEQNIDYWMNHWDQVGKLGKDGEVEKDYVIWALRDAAISAGYYKDAVETEEFWGNVAAEVENAIKEGRLETREGIQVSNLAAPIELAKWKEWLSCLIEGCIWTNTYHNLEANIWESDITAEDARIAEVLTRELFIYPDDWKFEFSGWIVDKQSTDSVIVSILNNKQETLYSCVVDGYREDITNAYSEIIRGNFPTGFNFRQMSEQEPNELVFSSSDEILYRISVTELLNEKQPYAFSNEKCDGAVEIAVATEISDLAKELGRSTLLPNVLINAYRILSIPLSILVLPCFIYLWIRTYKRNRETLIITLGLLASYLLLQSGVSLNYFEAYNRDGRLAYLNGAFPLQQLFILLVLFISIDFWFSKKRRQEN